MTKINCPIEDVHSLVPHSAEMVLLDRIVNYGDDFLVAECIIDKGHIFLEEEKFPTYLALEIMAQGIAAWSGCKALEQGMPIRLGYLLGSRKLHIYTPFIEINSKLQIKVKMSIQDSSGFGVFDCELIDLSNNQILLEGALNVFSPEE